MSTFDQFMLKDATDALVARQLDSAAIEESLKFYAGDHFQGGAGWVGQVPPDDAINRLDVMAQIQAGFVSENTIKEVVDRHVGGVLGREPAWDYVLRRQMPEGAEPTPDERSRMDLADAAMTAWWDQRRPLKAVRESLQKALLAGQSVLRVYVPRGLLDKEGKFTAGTLQDALAAIRVHALAPTVAGIVYDEATEAEHAIYTYTHNNTRYAEMQYVRDGSTYLRVVGSDDSLIESAPLQLGGRLLMYELRRDVLITPQIRQCQKAINLTVTKMLRNINMAGDRERIFFNAEPPSRLVDDGNGGKKRIAVPLAVGAGTASFMQGSPIVDMQGNITDRLNPSLNHLEPVDVKNFVDSRNKYYEMCLRQSHQTHALISGDATASGISRVQARAEYETDLGMTKVLVDDVLRWLLEVVLALASQFIGTPNMFADIRVEVNSIVDTGPLSPEERASNRDDMTAGLLSEETAMSRNGVDDVTAELQRIEEQKQRAVVVQPPQEVPV